jgi:hypothetical protein
MRYFLMTALILRAGVSEKVTDSDVSQSLTFAAVTVKVMISPDGKFFVLSDGLFSWSGPDLPGVDTIETITFSPQCKSVVLQPGAFGRFVSLKSITFPACVESLPRDLFVRSSFNHNSPVTSVTFAVGSNLRVIDEDAFNGCFQLTFLSLPASVKLIEPAAFSSSGIRQIAVGPGNLHFRVVGDYLMDFPGVSIVHYFGTGSIVTIPDQVETIGSDSFLRCRTITALQFGPKSVLSTIEYRAFEGCENLISISIPASVETLSALCFRICQQLTEVQFASGSRLKRIGDQGFALCSRLTSITLPSSIEFLDDYCFSGCSALVSVRFDGVVNVVRWGASVFGECSSLTSLTVPHSVKFIGPNCFQLCPALSALIFESPTVVEDLLDVPPRWTGEQMIPDSVKRLKFSTYCQRGCYCVLKFGVNSQLEKVESATLDRPFLPHPWDEVIPRCFVQVTSQSLRKLRLWHEFADSVERRRQ